MKNIRIEVSIPHDYVITSQNPYRKMSVYGWHEDMTAKRTARELPGNIGAYYLENCQVEDADEQPLPPELYVIVYGLIGRGFTAWNADRAFISKEKAEAHVQKSQAGDCRYWVVPAGKLS